MKTEEILKLVEAGFTKDEILGLDKDSKEEPEKEEPEKEEPEKEEPEKEEPEKKEPEQPDTLKFIAEQFEKMTKAIQESNIINSDTKLKSEDIKTGPEILAEVIAPPERKRGTKK